MRVAGGRPAGKVLPLTNHFDYEADSPDFDVRLVGETSRRCHYEISFPAPQRVDWAEGNLAGRIGDRFRLTSRGHSRRIILSGNYSVYFPRNITTSESREMSIQLICINLSMSW